MSTARILTGDALTVLRTLPDESVQSCVTSPPYFGLRDYGHDGQMGLESTPDEYVAGMVAVFREVRRVLKLDGVMWLNVGDTMNNRRRIRSSSHEPSLNGFAEETWADSTRRGMTRMSLTHDGLKEKDTFGIPWMLAFALRSDGWYLRQEIIWAKGFGKPEPSPDRLPSRHESVFILSRSKRYAFDRSSLPEYASGSVWSVPPTGAHGHGAGFTDLLVSPCVKASSATGDVVLDPFGGAGTTALVSAKLGRDSVSIELNPDNVALAAKRIRTDFGLLCSVEVTP